jgi:protein-S-isoprenylcysteine O-methyltransferase Ste14
MGSIIRASALFQLLYEPIKFEQCSMKYLELKIPPLVLMIIFGALMALSSVFLPHTLLDQNATILVLFCSVTVALALSLSASYSFKKANTTVNPLLPQATHALVTQGIYQYSRNPMYVGFTICLIGWAVFLNCPWLLPHILVFVSYLTRFQIKPEERILTTLFAKQYTDYQQHVRRWC